MAKPVFCIEKYSFDQTGRDRLALHSKGTDWPVVYLISNDKELYIGESTSAAVRMDQHLRDPNKLKHSLKTIQIVFYNESNKSVILDYEQRLIKCCHAEAKFRLINKNPGQSASHEYYRRSYYGNKFRTLWKNLKTIGIVQKDLETLENEDIFKYSPYNALTVEQNAVSSAIINDICDKLENPSSHEGISLVNGGAGTGKTVLAISLISSLVNAVFLDETDLSPEALGTEKIKALLRLKKILKKQKRQHLTIGIVFPMTGIRGTIKKVFTKSGTGLKGSMVLSPYALKKKKYDILLVDEAHRLARRVNMGRNFYNFDNTSTLLGFNKYKNTQLDWILKQGTYNILFYDKDQSIKSTDITHSQFQGTLKTSGKSLNCFSLTTQLRCAGGDDFLIYLKDIMACRAAKQKNISNYDFRIFDDVDAMVSKIRSLNKKYDLCRTVAGYSWPWITKNIAGSTKDDMSGYNKILASGKYDISIQGHHYVWNLVTEGWLHRKDAVYTIGCIHSVQGLDLNYVGVIFGKEIDYDPVNNCIIIDKDEFCDAAVKTGCSEDELKGYIINTYTTNLARGIKGCYVYACNPNLQAYLKGFIKEYKK